MSIGTPMEVAAGLTGWMHVSADPETAAEKMLRRDITEVLLRQRLARQRLDDPALVPSNEALAVASDVDRCLAAAAASTSEAVLLATALPALLPVLAGVAVRRPLAESPDYLLAVAGAYDNDSMGRPSVEPLPVHLEDGMSVLRFDEMPNGTLLAALTFVRRAWERDVLVALCTTEIGVIPFAYEALCDLLAAVQPIQPGSTP